jgi:ligand-binding sensor domain-containing protein
VTGVLEAESGEVWVTLSGGLAQRATPEADWEFVGPEDLPAYTLYGGVEAPDGALYFGSDDGVLRVADGERSVWRAPNTPSVASFGAIQPGPDLGQLWFIEAYGTRTDVVAVADDTWQPGPVLNCDYCVPLARDADGRLWAGGDLGVWAFDAAGGVVLHLTAEDGLPADGVYSVAFAPTGEAWLATPGGVAVYDGESVTEVYNSETAGLASDDVHAVWATSDGALWAATESGLSRLDLSGEWTHFGAGDPFESDVRVNDLAEDSTGAVWLATAGEGVYRYAGGAWTNYRPVENGAGLPSTEIKCVTLAPDGSLWFGASYSGAAHLAGDAWEVFGVEDGLIHSDVNDIVVDEQGAVWFATSGGVSRYQP